MLLRIFYIAIFLFFATACKKESQYKTASPIKVFNELWKVMENRYALFSTKEVNWKAIYDEYKGVIDDNMTEKELFKKLSDMLKKLKDGHVALMAPFDTTVYNQFYTSYPKNFNYNNLVNNYWETDYKKLGTVVFKVKQQIGYIYCGTFTDEITNEQLNTIFDAIKTVKGLIIDVRNNTGGNTANAGRLAKFFITKKLLVKYELFKSGKGHNDFFAPQPFYLTPAKMPFTKPIVVLTNRACFSACNDFVLYVSNLSNVKVIGDQTGGGGGIPYNYILTNGWKLQYTGSLSLSILKQPVENGIQPHISVGIDGLNEVAGKDPILEKAFSLLQQ